MSVSDLRKLIEEKAPRTTNIPLLVGGLTVSSLVLLALVWIVLQEPEPRNNQSVERIDPDQYDPASDIAALESADGLPDTETTLTVEPDNLQSIDFNQVVDVSLHSWEVMDESQVSEDLLPTYSQVVEDRVLVKLNQNLWTKDIGDSIQFSIPQRDEIFLGTVTRADTDQIRYRTLEGTISDGAEDYPFTVSLGEKRSYVNVSTMTGVYELVANTQYGWLMPGQNMDKNVDYSVPDHFIIDPDPHSHTLDPDP